MPRVHRPRDNNRNNNNGFLQNSWNISRALRWVVNNPLKSLTVALAFSIFGVGRLMSRNRALQSETELVPCGTELNRFVPENSPAYMVTKEFLSRDCRGVDDVPLLFIEANANAYSTEFCFLHNLENCNRMKGNFKAIAEVKQKKINPNGQGIQLIPEGNYGITDSKKTIATAAISTCVGVAITSLHSSPVLLAHINAENIQAHDEYLKGRFADPFKGIRDFVRNKALNWQVTIVSGSSANLAYVKTVLENMGLSNIDSYCELSWALDLSSNNQLNSQLNNGNIMIRDGEISFIENAQDFQRLIPTIPKNQKNKPAALAMK